MTLWNSLVDGLGAILEFFHDVMEPLVGTWAWALAIISLTLVVRIALLPLAIKQINSMRAMQKLQPEMKKVQAKYKADRGLMRTDPEKFKAKRAKQQEELMKLYKEHNVNPAAGCLPLVLQMPIFFALFRLLMADERAAVFAQADFFLIRDLTGVPREALTLSPFGGTVGIGALLLVVAMGATTYLSQKQMMANNPAAADQPHMKIMLYVMPIMLTVFAFNFPVGVLLYWVTTNVWTMAQQWVMFRTVEPPPVTPAKA